MITELNRERPLRRLVGGLVVELRAEGLRIRGHRKRLALTIPWDELVKLGLQLDGYALTERDWAKPREVLRKLARHQKHRRFDGGRGVVIPKTKEA